MFEENIARNMVKFHSMLTGGEHRTVKRRPATMDSRPSSKKESVVAMIKEALTQVLRNKPDKPLEFLRLYFLNLRRERINLLNCHELI